MTVLEKSARNQLDKAVQAARRAATTGADRALRALSVEQEKKPAHLSPEQNELRRQLRVVCRRLGSWDALIRAVAYEQWHRMLFARFLAENNLLIHPKYHAPVTLDECAELARDRGIDQWEVAAEFAAGMLPGIFQKDDPLLLVKFAPEDRAALQEILSAIPAETFLTQDALGWTYQFWQTEEKEKVNKSERKIEGADICAVTQLFTEPYMVQFLLQNTLGAWWLSIHPESPLRKEWAYYKDQVQHDFSIFPKFSKDLKILDPSCGSGHFLVEAFHMLLSMRNEEGESRDDAIKGIVRDNLHGLELDPRCIQIAGFAIAMEAWKAGFPTDQYLPLPNLACVGLPIRAEKTEWLKLAAGDGMLENALGQYYDLFRNADSLGSLIQINEEGTLVPGDVLMQKLESALVKEKAVGDPVAEAFGETASGILKAVQFLRRKDFHFVVTNPPFLGSGKYGESLKKYLVQHLKDDSSDLAITFIIRSKSFLKNSGIMALVNPQNWLYAKSYEKMRINLCKTNQIRIIIKLGAGAFEEISGEVVKAILFSMQNSHPNNTTTIWCNDYSNIPKNSEKANSLQNKQLQSINQLNQIKNQDSRILLSDLENKPLLSKYVDFAEGTSTGDNFRYVRKFWELNSIGHEWEKYAGADPSSRLYGGREHIVFWEQGNGSLAYSKGARIQGLQFLGKTGFLVGRMSKLTICIFEGTFYDKSCVVLCPKQGQKFFNEIYYYLTSEQYSRNVRILDSGLAISTKVTASVPFDLPYWEEVAKKNGPLPEPHSDDPTQWLFMGDIISSEQPLHVAIASMLGYHWPKQPSGNDSFDSLIDKDGIVCIPPVWGERPAVDRLHNILASVYGNEWSPQKEVELLKNVGYSKSGGLEGFLRDDFFKSHSTLFQQRPFIWQIWDGAKDGFSALVNYHKLDRNLLQKLIYTYLGNWITQQKDEVRQEKPGAERRLAAAEALKRSLEKILEGEKPFDIYVRWKPLHEQAIGWDLNLNDGVRMNIRPFIESGVLRWTPNIKWGKDPGSDPLPNCSGTTERLNDLHFTLEEKKKAREAVQ